MLCQTGRLCQRVVRTMQRRIWALLKTDCAARTAQVGATSEVKLAGGDVQEAFRCLKGWYQNASDSMACPCPQTMEQQTAERVALYARRNSPGDPLPLNIDPIPINDGTPTDAEVREAAQKLTNGQAPGALGMCATDVKRWLHGMRLKDDPESETGNKNAGDNWRLFLKLSQAVWDHGDIPPQLLWVIVVLIPKGGGNYQGIGLLEPIWKVCEGVMDMQLNRIPLHESLHGCCNGRGTGTSVMEAKLAQQLAHLEQVPFYGIFLNLKKVFDLMDCKCCLLILGGYEVGPKII